MRIFVAAIAYVASIATAYAAPPGCSKKNRTPLLKGDRPEQDRRTRDFLVRNSVLQQLGADHFFVTFPVRACSKIECRPIYERNVTELVGG